MNAPLNIMVYVGNGKEKLTGESSKRYGFATGPTILAEGEVDRQYGTMDKRSTHQLVCLKDSERRMTSVVQVIQATVQLAPPRLTRPGHLRGIHTGLRRTRVASGKVANVLIFHDSPCQALFGVVL